MKTDRLYNLLDAYQRQSISLEERQELLQALADPSNADTLKKWIEQRWEKEKLPELLSSGQSQQLYETIREVIAPKKKIGYFYPLRRIAAAAVVVLMITGAYFLFTDRQGQPQDQLSTTIAQPLDVKAPDASRARITLADGQVLYLDSLANGQLAQQKGVEIIKLDDGQLQYKGTSAEIVYNTLDNPRGSEVISITLADGTKVWLNAASGITYPTSFTAGERKVELRGEAYFEVAKNEKMPFIVSIANKAEVKVLGTHFNINAYEDEPAIKTTLIEGSVQVFQKFNNLIPQYLKLHPGEQASLNASGAFNIAKIDIDESIAWKKGLFNFNDTDLESIMKNLSRWYDIDVQYESKDLKALTFGAIISRRSNISAILNLMKMTGTVDFKIIGNTIIVSNK
ncbi:MAG: hypothetical protein A2X18_03225 [Bacteroidetes bacterium GWF2_40_14]|nr:MAG: hypothetical protein A2X18_03225 [Bacteroidetes bacterium GWF2_40_14]